MDSSLKVGIVIALWRIEQDPSTNVAVEEKCWQALNYFAEGMTAIAVLQPSERAQNVAKKIVAAPMKELRALAVALAGDDVTGAKFLEDLYNAIYTSSSYWTKGAHKMGYASASQQ